MGHLWLIGMMGSGKSVVGSLVAQRLAIPFYDTDEIIVRNAGTSIASIFDEEGETGFRERECIAVRTVAGAPDGVVAAGGGAVLDAANVETMRSAGTTVLLDADVETLERRLRGSDDRPLLRDRVGDALRSIAEERRGMYRSAADHVIDARRPIEEVADELEGLWRRS